MPLGMSDLVNGVSVLLAFYVGYRYGLKVVRDKAGESETDGQEKQKTNETVYSSRGNYKMLLVVRNDLKMGKGKIAAQCGHGAVGAYERAMKHCPQLVRAWDRTGCAKIAVKVESEAELVELSKQARAMGLNTCLITDAGHTQIAPNTKTVLAIGPDEVHKIDKVTSHLKLL